VSSSEVPAASLKNLNDIILPEAVSWWPPAEGWYLLSAVLVVVLAWIAFRSIRRWRENRYRRQALVLLNQLKRAHIESAWREIPELLKRTALAAFPRDLVASSCGANWTQFLHRTAPRMALEPGAAALLERMAYATGDPDKAEVEQLFISAEAWIKYHDCRQVDPAC
jgi:hypothetical protein